MSGPDPQPDEATPPRPAAAHAWHWLLQLAVTFALGALSIVLTFVFRAHIHQSNFIFFFPSVILAAWYGGFRAGALLGLLAVLTADVLFIAPVGRLAINSPTELAFLLLFLFISAVVSMLVNRMRQAQEVAQRREVEVRRHALQLQEQAVELETQAAELELQAVEQEQTAEEARQAREAAERAYASSEAERRRVSILAETSRALSESTEYAARLAALGRLVVRELADYCLIDVLADDGRVKRLVSEARDPTHEPLVAALRRYPPHADSPVGPGRVLASGEPEIALELETGRLEAMATSPEELQVLRGMRPHSVISMPLTAGVRRLGAITLIRSTDEPRFDEADVELARVLATRAGLLLEMARLYRDATLEIERRRTVETQLHQKAAELEQRTREAEAAQHQAQEASAAKSQFLAVMSHELRTPLNAIMGYTDLIQSGAAQMELSETGRSFLDRIRVSVLHLRGLIDEILSLARIEAGKEEVELQRVDLAAVLREVAAMLQAEALRKGLQLQVDAPDEVVVTTDPGKVRQIVINLASNAVKFTHRGHVRLTVHARRGLADICVCDTGAGIPPEHIERIFEPFTQVDQSRTRQAGGTGLGLSVSRHLANLLGGSIRVESTVGEGSQFTVSLPTGD